MFHRFHRPDRAGMLALSGRDCRHCRAIATQRYQRMIETQAALQERMHRIVIQMAKGRQMLRLAKLTGDDSGVIFYDSVTMYAYPPIFRNKTEAYAFLDWFEGTYKVPFNGYSGDHYAAMEQWYRETGKG